MSLMAVPLASVPLNVVPLDAVPLAAVPLVAVLLQWPPSLFSPSSSSSTMIHVRASIFVLAACRILPYG